MTGLKYSSCDGEGTGSDEVDEVSFCERCDAAGNTAFGFTMTAVVGLILALLFELYHWFQGSMQWCSYFTVVGSGVCNLAAMFAWLACHLKIRDVVKDSDVVTFLGRDDTELSTGFYLSLAAGCVNLVLSWLVCAGSNPTPFEHKPKPTPAPRGAGGAVHATEMY